MKKAIFSMAALALLLASCDTNTKDSYQTIPYPEYNLIVDNADASQMAQVSGCNYELKFNISQGCVDVKTSDLIVNNQKVSFETDTMVPRQIVFDAVVNGQNQKVANTTFSKKGQAGIGSSASDLKGTLVYCYMPNGSSLLNPDYQIAYVERLDMSYDYAGRYHVQTFWPSAFYVGQTVASADGDTYTTKGSDYLAQIDFEKKVANVYVYNAEFSADKEQALPRVISFEEIPVVYTHEGFSLEAEAPKTKVLGKKDNLTALVDSVGFEAKDFSMFLTSSDLSDAIISYKLAGRNVTFRGSSVLK